MAYTTAGAVQSALGQCYKAGASLTAAIATAHVLVQRMEACAASKGLTHTDEEREMIERWVAAHCYAMQDKPYAERKTLSANGVFQGRTGMGLESTDFGQTALLLDYTGCLRQVQTSGASVGMKWLGKAPSEQTPYEDRD